MIPPGGFLESNKLTIQREYNTTLYPYSIQSKSVIYIPDYQSKEILKERLLISMSEKTPDLQKYH